MPSYDRALDALRSWLNSWPGVGHVAVGMHRQGFDLQLHPVRRARLARDVLHDGHGTLSNERDRHRVGAYAVARDAAGGVGGEAEGLDGRRGSVGAADQRGRVSPRSSRRLLRLAVIW